MTRDVVLHRLTGQARSTAVAKAFLRIVKAGNVQAVITYKSYDDLPVSRTVALTGFGPNPTYAGTAEAVVFRPDHDSWMVEFIPYTRLISIKAAV